MQPRNRRHPGPTKRTAFGQAVAELIHAINVLLHAGLLLPSMMMWLATVDILAGLARPSDAAESNGEHFREWVERFLLPGSKLKCTAEDLWGARCGMLHTYTPVSRRSRSGRVRKVLFASGRLDESTRATTEMVTGEYVFVISRDVFDAMSTALQRFAHALNTDKDLERRVMVRAGDFLGPLYPTYSRERVE